jgi:hypothetical protein
LTKATKRFQQIRCRTFPPAAAAMGAEGRNGLIRLDHIVDGRRHIA